jgi:hypothetical protein
VTSTPTVTPTPTVTATPTITPTPTYAYPEVVVNVQPPIAVTARRRPSCTRPTYMRVTAASWTASIPTVTGSMSNGIN